MNESDESRGAWPRSAPAPHQQPPGEQRAPLHADLTPAFWKDVPVLSWQLQMVTGRLQFSAMPPGAEAVPGATAHLETLAGELVESQQDGPAPIRLNQVLTGPDGQPRHFLILGFPVGRLDGPDSARLAGVAIDLTRHQARIDALAHQALVDELTGLYNLRGFFLFAEHELKVARRRGTRCAVVYADVDGLKRINDGGGHQQGSAVLVEAASLLRHVFRECDVIARLGGDEFAVFAADVHGDPAQLRKRLAAAMAGEGVSWSLSAGVGSPEPDPALRLADLLGAADEAMYREKFDKLAREAGLSSSGDTRS